ncbi:MAG: hypothetical protein ACI8WB_003153 [Phenylobacterium sp.]|jgi:hypothetical protein
MKAFIIFITSWFLTTNAFSHTTDSVDVVYVKGAKVHYIGQSKDKSEATVAVYLNMNSNRLSYQHKINPSQRMVDAIIYQDRLTIILTSNNNYHMLILNKLTGEVIDNLWGFFAKTSPDGRFIVYKQWRARYETSKYGKPAGVTVAYDLTKSPIENRTLAQREQLKKAPTSLQNNQTKVGIPVFPLGDYNKPGYGWITDETQRVGVYGDFAWYRDDAFVFLIRSGNQIPKIINAIYNQKSNKFDIKTHQLSNKAFISNSKNKGIDVSRIETTGQQIKLYTDNAIIRLDSLEQLKLLE